MAVRKNGDMLAATLQLFGSQSGFSVLLSVATGGRDKSYVAIPW